MTNITRVIEGLQHCLQGFNGCPKCPYAEELGDLGCRQLVIRDALEILGERQPVKPIIEYYWNHTYGKCGICKAPLPALEGLKSKFCWMCGQAIEWDEPPKTDEQGKTVKWDD